MKKTFLVLLLFITISVKAQSPFNFKKDMVWVEKAELYVCKYEVTNAEYRAFTNQLSLDSSVKYYPDTLLWVTEFQTHMGDPMMAYYNWHSAFNGYPVVGVSYEGAVLYCKWLTKKYGEGKYIFRLPTPEEYQGYAKVDTFSVAGGLENVRDGEGTYLLNYKPGHASIDGDTVHIYYNSIKNTFFRFIMNEIPEDDNYGFIKNGYNWNLQSYWNGHLYFTHCKSIHKKIKMELPDSITYYNPKTDSYKKEKVSIYFSPLNFYDDGYMYVSASRIYKNSEASMSENGGIEKGVKVTVIYNKSTYPADKNGIYDLAGNVSEMVGKEGVAMSGNWYNGPEACTYNHVHPYKGASTLVGFRIVAEPVK